MLMSRETRMHKRERKKNCERRKSEYEQGYAFCMYTTCYITDGLFINTKRFAKWHYGWKLGLSKCTFFFILRFSVLTLSWIKYYGCFYYVMFLCVQIAWSELTDAWKSVSWLQNGKWQVWHCVVICCHRRIILWLSVRVGVRFPNSMCCSSVVRQSGSVLNWFTFVPI